MAYTEAQKKATMKYHKENMEQIAIRVKKGDKAALQAEAKAAGESMAQYVVKSVNDRAEKQILTPSNKEVD